MRSRDKRSDCVRRVITCVCPGADAPQTLQFCAISADMPAAARSLRLAPDTSTGRVEAREYAAEARLGAFGVAWRSRAEDNGADRRGADDLAKRRTWGVSRG